MIYRETARAMRVCLVVCSSLTNVFHAYGYDEVYSHGTQEVEIVFYLLYTKQILNSEKYKRKIT